VGVQPGLCYRAVSGDLRDHVIGDGEEERGVRVEEAPGYGGVRVFKPEGSRFQLPESSGDAVHRLGGVVGGVGGGGVGDADAGGGGGEGKEAEKREREEEEAQHGCCGSAAEREIMEQKIS